MRAGYVLSAMVLFSDSLFQVHAAMQYSDYFNGLSFQNMIKNNVLLFPETIQHRVYIEIVSAYPGVLRKFLKTLDQILVIVIGLRLCPGFAGVFPNSGEVFNSSVGEPILSHYFSF
jgi:hypothetical protein